MHSHTPRQKRVHAGLALYNTLIPSIHPAVAELKFGIPPTSSSPQHAPGPAPAATMTGQRSPCLRPPVTLLCTGASSSHADVYGGRLQSSNRCVRGQAPCPRVKLRQAAQLQVRSPPQPCLQVGVRHHDHLRHAHGRRGHVRIQDYRGDGPCAIAHVACGRGGGRVRSRP